MHKYLTSKAGKEEKGEIFCFTLVHLVQASWTRLSEQDETKGKKF